MLGLLGFLPEAGGVLRAGRPVKTFKPACLHCSHCTSVHVTHGACIRNRCAYGARAASSSATHIPYGTRRWGKGLRWCCPATIGSLWHLIRTGKYGAPEIIQMEAICPRQCAQRCLARQTTKDTGNGEHARCCTSAGRALTPRSSAAYWRPAVGCMLILPSPMQSTCTG